MHFRNCLRRNWKDSQEQDIISPLGIDQMTEWCNSFVLVPKHNGKVRLCLYPARLSQALIRPVNRGPALNDIFPKLNNVKYLSLIDKRSSYLTTFVCQFGRYRYKRLPFGAAPIGDMFQCKIDKLFQNLLNVFGIADDMLVEGYDTDGKGHNEML